MKRILQLSILLGFSLSYGQATLPFYEGFNYSVGTNIIGATVGTGVWGNASTSAVSNDALVVASPAWVGTGYPAATGGALSIGKGGDDPFLVFSPVPTTGAIYASFVLKVDKLDTGTVTTPVLLTTGTSTANGPAPSFFFTFAAINTSGTNSYAGALFLRRASSAETDKFYIGIGASNTVAVDSDVTWSTTKFTVGDEIHVVTSYNYETFISRMWLNPTIGTTEPAASIVTPVRGTVATPAGIAVDRLRINKNSAATAPFMTIDEIRAANNFGEAVGGASTLGLSKSEIVQLKVYPNPVSNGTLNISSANNSEKEVAIYNILGQKVFQTQTTSGAINVSSLGKGGYLLKITEDGKSETKKLIVQ